MTKNQQQIVKYLMAGMYMMRSKNHSGNSVYRMYSGNMVLVRFVSVSSVQKSIISGLLKEDDHHRITLNLSKVRQLDGRSWIKKHYKSQKPVNANGKP